MADQDDVQRALGRIEGKLEEQDRRYMDRFESLDKRLDGIARSKDRTHGRMTSWGAVLISAAALIHTILGGGKHGDRQAAAAEVAPRAGR